MSRLKQVDKRQPELAYPARSFTPLSLVMETALRSTLQRVLNDYVTGLDRLDASSFPVKLRDLHLKELQTREGKSLPYAPRMQKQTCAMPNTAEGHAKCLGADAHEEVPMN